ncbi:OLC1v1028761C1 [Oldenlandia corymbosa var. corymbosa]|uniref:OLC1v1028761C1 n=1 Tax=Oldenlandia corymbosa var. corymbosa TaxID=529605 RepID=A0AAV1CCW9_OLDCO|nr:OLC1v1028761C1 [Oldenlandia corymbosa var. corymbosa]
MLNFPEELVIEILSRLPAKSLGKFKCVSKSWLALISTQRFIKTHLSIASGRDDYEHHRLVFKVSPFSSDGANYELHSVSSLLHGPASETTTVEVFDLDCRLSPTNSLFFVGSCNGLLCIFHMRNEVFYLHNPCTTKLKGLPDSGIHRGYGICRNFGFGYVRCSDDYKVLGLFKILIESLNGPVSFKYEFRLYSLKNNSWRKIEDLKIGIPKLEFLDNFKFASENLHWLVDDGIDGLRIGRFDLANETYQVMDCPNNKDSLYDHGLGVLGGCLSLFYDRERTHADIWIMKDYGIEESWTKVFSIPYIDTPGDRLFEMAQSICTSRNGEMLFILGSKLLLYDPKSNTLTQFPQIGIFFRMIMYVESLVWPDIHDLE